MRRIESQAPLTTLDAGTRPASSQSFERESLLQRGPRTVDRHGAASHSLRVPDESVVVDTRSAVTPAQAVEEKLQNLLGEAALSVSHLQIKRLLRGRVQF
jgi:hypothetical protein